MRTTERFAPGDRIGNYRVERELGTTGAGVILAVVHLVLPRRATIKVIQAAVAHHQPFAIQLLREACILDALSHAGIPRVYDSGLLPDRRPWFAIEQVGDHDHYESLADRLIAGPLAVGEVAVLVRDLAGILAHTHRRGIVHRGLRPDRIAVSPELAVTIVDWSDARTHDAASRIPSIPVPGSRAFVAPELLRGDVVDDRADIFALGMIAYQALTGMVATGMPIGERCPGLLPELAQLIDQMIATDRFDRPSAVEVVDALEELAEVLLDVRATPKTTMPRLRKPRWTPAGGITLSETLVARIALERKPA